MATKSKKDLTIIILSYNTKSVTDECLTRVLEASKFCEKNRKNKVEVIVVDNGSSDESAGMIKKKYPSVNLIESKTNLGFAKGNNLAMKKAKSPYFLLLNSDVFLEKDTLVKALDYITKNKICDVLTIKLTYPDGRFQPCGGYLPTPLRTFIWMMGIESISMVRKITGPIHIWDKSFYKKQRFIEWASGAFFLLRREVYQKTNGFDENLFLYSEDIEWCKRIKDKGFKICYTPEISVVHLEGASSKNNIKNQLMSQMRGLIYFHKKYYPKEYKFTGLAIQIGLFLRYILYKLIGNRNYSEAYLEVFQNLNSSQI